MSKDDDPDRTPPHGLPVQGIAAQASAGGQVSGWRPTGSPPGVASQGHGQFLHANAEPPPPAHGYGEPDRIEFGGDPFGQPGGQFLHANAVEPGLARGVDLDGGGGGGRNRLDADVEGTWGVAPSVIGAAESLPSPIPRPPAPKPPPPKPEPESEPRKRSLWGKITGRE